MRSFVQVLTTPTADTSGTTLLLHFDNRRYLIGSLAEGTQRASVQMGARLIKVSQCFITGRTEWANVGGMIGMILTLADSSAASLASGLEDALNRARLTGKKLGLLDDAEKMKQLEDEARGAMKSNTLTFFGPPNLNYLLATARRFVFRKGMPVELHEFREDVKPPKTDSRGPDWADENIKVWAISVLPSNSARERSKSGEGTTSLRKRSIDEVYGNGNAALDNTSDELSQKERDLLTTKAVVSEMFDSSWRLDTLYETPLSQVKLPASVFVRNPETNKIEKYHGPLPNGAGPLSDPDLPVLVRKPWPGALIERLPCAEPAKEAVSYIIRNHLQRGKFKPERAKELAVEKGTLWGKLSSGETVLNVHGETITPDMVLGESKIGGGFAVVDLPEPSYIEGLLSRPEWADGEVMAGVGAIFWICGRGVVTDCRVQAFMHHHGGLDHIVSSPDCCPNNIALDSAAAATVRLRKIDPKRYGIPIHDGSLALSKEEFPNGVKFHAAERGQIVQLEPSMEFQENQVVPPMSILEIEESMSQDVLQEAAKAHEAIQSDNHSNVTWQSSLPDKDAEIITLGTGSALPSKYRNVSATLLRLPGWGCVLFDAGENTIGQLRRVFAPEELKQVLRELKAIIVSHMHADHHLGVVSVIKAWYSEVHNSQPAGYSEESVRKKVEGKSRLSVISEPAMQHWLAEYASVEDYGYSRISPLHISPADPFRERSSRLTWFIPPHELDALHSAKERAWRLDQNHVPADLLGLTDVQAVLVPHCHGALAVSITFPSGFKASYSGDCRPSKKFARIGQGSTVCIHEATFDDELLGDAQAKNHSTTSEALGIAQAMNAKACVLTHFSQRYQKFPVLEQEDNEGQEIVPSVGEEDEAAAGQLENEPEYPLENIQAETDATLPDQKTVDGTGTQYSLPSKREQGLHKIPGGPGATNQAPTAVKFKLASDMKVCVAFDYMRVKVGDIAQMEKFVPALLKLFAEEEREEDRDTAESEGQRTRKEKLRLKQKQKEKQRQGTRG